jgi:Cd2+/Zn2+-exporting ATPase
MGDDIGQLAYAVALARRTRRVIRQNLAIALGVIVVLIGATTSGVAGIGPAVVFHEGSTIVVIVNALRLLRFRVPAPVPRQAARESLVEAA